MRINICIIFILLVAFVSISNGGDRINPSYSFSAGAMNLDGKTGMNINVGIEYDYKNFILNANFIDLLITNKKNERYYMDHFSNGTSRCRDRTNGQFAKTEKCDPTYNYDFNLYYGINYLIKNDYKKFMIGAGFFTGERTIPTISATYIIENTKLPFFIRGEAGSDLARLYSGISF